MVFFSACNRDWTKTGEKRTTVMTNRHWSIENSNLWRHWQWLWWSDRWRRTQPLVRRKVIVMPMATALVLKRCVGYCTTAQTRGLLMKAVLWWRQSWHQKAVEVCDEVDNDCILLLMTTTILRTSTGGYYADWMMIPTVTQTTLRLVYSRRCCWQFRRL